MLTSLKHQNTQIELLLVTLRINLTLQTLDSLSKNSRDKGKKAISTSFVAQNTGTIDTCF